MEVSSEDDSLIETITSQKKMKQAQLPFEMFSSAESSNAFSTKKRKLTSSIVSDSRSPKIIKVTTKEKSAKKVEMVELGESDTDNELNEKKVDEETIESTKRKDRRKVEEVSSDKKRIKSKNKHEKGKKMKAKNQIKHGALAAFLKKVENKQEENDIQIISGDECESRSNKNDNSALERKMDSKREKSVIQNLDTDNKRTSDDESIVNLEISEKNCEPSVIKVDNTNKKRLVTKCRTLDNRDSLHNKNKLSSVANENDVINNNSETGSDVSLSNSEVDEEVEKSKNSVEEKDKTVDEKCSEKAGGSIVKNKKLTPKQLEKKMESAKRLEYRMRLKMEKEKKRQERENRRREKEEKRKEKEEKERAEKEQRRKEKELKELKKQMEIEQKQKEKEAKEEDRRKREEAKEEERKKKEEEKLEAERKKQKAASNFASFFVAKKQESKPIDKDNIKEKNFMPFEIKADMKIAPICRRHLSEYEKSRLDESHGKEVDKPDLYLEEIKSKRREIRRSKRTWSVEAKDVVIIEEEDDGSCNLVENVPIEKHHVKLFMFTENRRPPYWGTWRKRSNCIKPRKPFSKDVKWFDYEVDSDEEWEEEEPGESIRGSDDERDEENPDDNEYDIDNEFMVPHGYLSDEEARADEEDAEDTSPETQKVKLKLLGEEFEAERNTKTLKIKPKVIGCVWQGPVNSYPTNITPHLQQFLMARQAWVRETPIVLGPVPGNENANECGTSSQDQQVVKTKKTKVPDVAIPNLIRLIHGNTHGKIFLVKEFMAFWSKNNEVTSRISKVSLSQKIRELGKWINCPEEGPMYLRACWYVTEDIRKQYDCQDIELPNRWEYTLKPKRKLEIEIADKSEKKKKVPLITQFTKKITQKEMQGQLTAKFPQVVLSKITPPAPSKPPKRVALISVGRGEEFSKSSRDKLFVKSRSDRSEEIKKESGEGKSYDNGEEVMIVDEIDVRGESKDETRVDKKFEDSVDPANYENANETSSCREDLKSEKFENTSAK